MAERLTVGAVYTALEGIAPFASQANWDNSGLLVGDLNRPVSRVLLALDCSAAAVEEAKARRCELLISHHPVIFSPVRTVSFHDPVARLAAYGISAICMHTPLDSAPCGVNATLRGLLAAPLQLQGEPQLLEGGYGMVLASETSMQADELAASLRKRLGCQVVRYCAGTRPFRRIGIAGGAGGSLLEEAIAAGCDAFITGDVKHSCWYLAKSYGVALFDCGHYHTEAPVMARVRAHLAAALPTLLVLSAEADQDPVQYETGKGEE